MLLQAVPRFEMLTFKLLFPIQTSTVLEQSALTKWTTDSVIIQESIIFWIILSSCAMGGLQSNSLTWFSFEISWTD